MKLAKRYVIEYAKDILANKGAYFTKEINKILYACNNGYITSAEAVSLIARECNNSAGITDDEYKEKYC